MDKWIFGLITVLLIPFQVWIIYTIRDSLMSFFLEIFLMIFWFNLYAIVELSDKKPKKRNPQIFFILTPVLFVLSYWYDKIFSPRINYVFISVSPIPRELVLGSVVGWILAFLGCASLLLGIFYAVRNWRYKLVT